MDAPIGALGDGFEERLVLEERSDLARWGEIFLFLLMTPVALVAAYIVSAVVVLFVQFFWDLYHEPQVDALYCATLGLFVAALYFLYREYQTRAFREVAVVGGRLEVVRASGCRKSVQVTDARAWPTGLSFRLDSGECLMVRNSAEEKKRAALDQLLPALVAAEQLRLDSAGELRLHRCWSPLFKAVCRAVLVSGSLGVLACLVSWRVGLMCGAGLLVWMLGPLLRDFWGAGMVLSRAGLGRSRVEVPWSEVESCWTGDYFQVVLRVLTRRGTFRLVSSRNPLVWAVLIEELRG